MIQYFNNKTRILSDFFAHNESLLYYPSWIPMSIKISLLLSSSTDYNNTINKKIKQILTNNETVNELQEEGDDDNNEQLYQILSSSSQQQQKIQTQYQQTQQKVFRSNDASIQLAYNTSLKLLQLQKHSSQNNIITIIKLLDLCGTKKTDNTLLDLLLSLNIILQNNIQDKSNKFLKSFLQNFTRQYDNIATNQDDESLTYASLILNLLKQKEEKSNQQKYDATNTTTNSIFDLSNGWEQNRFTIRNYYINDTIFSDDILQNSSCNNTTSNTTTTNEQQKEQQKHIWETGAYNNMEELLLLDKIDEWLGRYKPLLLGKDGVIAATTTGERALADILAKAAKEDTTNKSTRNDGIVPNDDDSDIIDDEVGKNAFLPKGWIDITNNIGNKDEDHLSAYFVSFIFNFRTRVIVLIHLYHLYDEYSVFLKDPMMINIG